MQDPIMQNFDLLNANIKRSFSSKTPEKALVKDPSLNKATGISSAIVNVNTPEKNVDSLKKDPSIMELMTQAPTMNKTAGVINAQTNVNITPPVVPDSNFDGHKKEMEPETKPKGKSFFNFKFINPARINTCTSNFVDESSASLNVSFSRPSVSSDKLSLGSYGKETELIDNLQKACVKNLGEEIGSAFFKLLLNKSESIAAEVFANNQSSSTQSFDKKHSEMDLNKPLIQQQCHELHDNIQNRIEENERVQNSKNDLPSPHKIFDYCLKTLKENLKDETDEKNRSFKQELIKKPGFSESVKAYEQDFALMSGEKQEGEKKETDGGIKFIYSENYNCPRKNSGIYWKTAGKGGSFIKNGQKPYLNENDQSLKNLISNVPKKNAEKIYTGSQKKQFMGVESESKRLISFDEAKHLPPHQHTLKFAVVLCKYNNLLIKEPNYKKRWCSTDLARWFMTELEKVNLKVVKLDQLGGGETLSG